MHAEDAVTVTATRVERPSLEVPASIDRVHAEDIRFARPQVNLSESLGRVPGIVVQNRQNYAQDLQISSRGFGTRATFGIRGLRLLVDGIPASMPDGQGQVSHVDLGSVERIEVLRGPFAVMYGNAAGGVINVVTESGAREPGVSGDLSFGSYGTSRGALKAAWEAGIVSASSFRTDGYRQHSAARREQLNAKLNLNVGAASTVTVVANAFDSPATQDPLGLTRAQMDADPRQAVAQAFTFDTRKSVRQNQAGATLMHRLEHGTLAAAAYGGRRVVRQYLGFAGSAPPATTSGGVVDLDTGYGGASLRWTNEGSLAGRPLALAIGGEYELRDERRKGFVNLTGSLGALRRDEDDAVAATGAYAQAEWRFAERWIALAGLRANRVDFRATDHFIIAGNPDDSGRKTYNAATPAAGILYKLSSSSSLYANYGRGFETPTIAELAHQNVGSGLNFALNAARSRHLEAGIKAAFGPRGRVNAAVFDVETRNEIVVDVAAGGRTTFKNAGRTRRTGIELLAEAALPAGFEGVLAWTLLDAKFRDPFSSGAGAAAVTVAGGNVLPAVPRTTLYAELRWRDAPSGFSAALEAQHKARVAVNDTNTEFAPGYSVANFAAGFVQHAGQWRFSEYLRVDNLGNRRYAGSVIVNEGNGRFYEPAPGRNAVVGIQAKLAF